MTLSLTPLFGKHTHYYAIILHLLVHFVDFNVLLWYGYWIRMCILFLGRLFHDVLIDSIVSSIPISSKILLVFCKKE